MPSACATPVEPSSTPPPVAADRPAPPAPEAPQDPPTPHDGAESAPADPEPTSLDRPPEGLELTVRAEPIPAEGAPEGFGLRITLDVLARTPRPFDVGSEPAPHLVGHVRYADGTHSEFGDGCWAGGAPGRLLARGNKRRFVRRFGEDGIDAIWPGETLTLEVGLCHVGLPDGRWLDIPAATVVMQVPASGKQPTVRIEPR